MIKKEIAKAGKYLKESVEEDWSDDADIEDFFSDYNDRIDQIIRGYRNMFNKYSDHRKEILSDLANLRNKLSDAYDQLKSRKVEAVTNRRYSRSYVRR